VAEKFAWTEDYPFLSFDFNSGNLPPHTWTLLGECSSKIEHVLGTPLREDTAAELNMVYLAKGAHATTAIEGNTLSESQVKQRVKGEDINLPPTQDYLRQEVDNILGAYDHIVKQLRKGVPYHITPDELRKLHKVVLKGLEVEEGVVPGEFRRTQVGVGDYRCPPPDYVPEMIERGCQMLNAAEWQQTFGGPFVVPILRAILSHLYIAWIHPFGDGNGRTARLVEFDLMARAGVPIPCAHLLSDYYNRTRPKYYRALAMAQKGPKHFVCYAIEGLQELLREQIDLVRTQLLDVTWQNHVYSVFHKRGKSSTGDRQREVALELGKRGTVVSMYDIPTLSPKLAEYYGPRTGRTLRRDARELFRMKLIRYDGAGVRANLGLVLAFLPEKGAAITPEKVVAKGTEAA
jgi:Fic family protein